MSEFVACVFVEKSAPIYGIPITTRWLPSLTCFRVEHQNICSRPEQLLEVFVVTDFLYERRHLHCLQHRQEPHLVKHTHIHEYYHNKISP